jgi:hypothetical protein
MRKYPILSAFIVIGLMLFVTSCNRERPILNIENEYIVTGSGKTPSLEQVRVAIRKAVVAKTWRIRDAGANQFEATFTKGTKVARVTIKYSTKQYSILYKSSNRLFYDGTNIHRRYNAWIKGLRIFINRNFALL